MALPLPAPEPSARRGWLIPIGGKLNDDAIVARFVELCGGASARLVVIPTASSEPDTGPGYLRLFARHGVRHTRMAAFRHRSCCDDADWLAALHEADGVFLTGGDQLRLATVLNGTPAARILRERHRRGGLHIAGTSAGAAVLSRQMIARGAEGLTPRAGMVQLAAGFGLADSVIIDQHFRQRDRLGRLLTAVAYNPHCLGLGVDEDTAAFMAPDGTFEVLGQGAVTVIDPTDLQQNTIADVEHHEPISLTGLRVHVLAAGARFDLADRLPVLPKPGSDLPDDDA